MSDMLIGILLLGPIPTCILLLLYWLMDDWKES